MSGKLKTKGNMMLATKLDGILKVILCKRTQSSSLTPLSAQEDEAVEQILRIYVIFIHGIHSL